MEVTPGLHRISCLIGADKPLFQHLLTGEDCWLWVDTGVADTPQTYLLPYLTELPPPPAAQLALITHPDVDHFGGLAQLRSAFPGLVAMAHQADAPLIVDHGTLMAQRYLAHRSAGLVPPDWRQRQLLERAGAISAVPVRLRGGETFQLGTAGDWEVVHLPGHSPGHLGLWNAHRGTVILGDAVLGWGVNDVSGTVVTPPPYVDLASYLATIAKLETMPIETMYTSHYPVMSGSQVAEFLAECRAAVNAIGDAVRAHQRPGLSLGELCERVGAGLGRWPRESWLGLADPVTAELRATAGMSR